MKRYRHNEVLEIPNNWPISPGIHIDETIEELAEFPKNTRFFEVDHNDECTLFSIDKADKKRSFSNKYFYVSIWNSFLKDALEKNLIKDIVFKENTPIFPFGYISLSENGYRSAIYSRLTDENLYHKSIDSVEHHIIDGNYDTAIRELTVRLEDKMRRLCGATAKHYGMNLIDYFIKNAPKKKEILPHHLKYIRIQFKRFFAFVRNEFAHKINSPDMALTIAILFRCAKLHISIEETLGYSIDILSEDSK